jgi:hypothetical protein
LDAVADNIRTELTQGGYFNVLVTVQKNTDPYKFRVEYDATFGSQKVPQDVIDEVQLHYVPDPTLPLNASVTVTDKTEDLLTFRVNTGTRATQEQPSIGMDDDGNFTIAWVGNGQDLSFFNSVMAARFNRFGERQAEEFMVNNEDTSIHYDPFVSMSNDGYIVISWSETDDEDFLQIPGIFETVNARVYNPDGSILRNHLGIAGGSRSSSSTWDSGDNYIITWETGNEPDSVGGVSLGVQSIMFNLQGGIVRSQFRANGAPGGTLAWPRPFWHDATGSAPAVDADGDLVIAYDSFGPDASEDVFMDWSYFAPDMLKPQNADLLTPIF